MVEPAPKKYVKVSGDTFCRIGWILNETEQVTLKPPNNNLQSWLYPQIDYIPMFLRYIHNAYWKQPSSIISIEYQFAGYIFY